MPKDLAICVKGAENVKVSNCPQLDYAIALG